MAVEGTLDLFKLPEILQLISQQKKTGILTVQGHQDIVAISFLNGSIVAADALNQTVEEGLSQVLVQEGLVSPQDMVRATAEYQASGGRMIDHLVERGYVERFSLLEALRLQTHRLLEQLLRWNQGDFKFYSGDEVSYEEGFSPITVEELLVHAAESFPPPSPVPPPAPVSRPEPVPPQPVRPGLRVVGGEPSQVPPPVQPAAPRPAAVRPVRPVAPAPAAPSSIPVEREGGPFRRMRVEAPPAPPLSQGLAGKLLAAAFAVLLVVILLLVPGALVLPFPWQNGERAELAADQRTALYLKIDRAAKTFCLLKGRFPDRLEELVGAGLLARHDLRDPQGHPLQYVSSEDNYTLHPVADGKPVVGAEITESITGNFLLDPEFLAVSTEPTAAPLVLLD